MRNRRRPTVRLMQLGAAGAVVTVMLAACSSGGSDTSSATIAPAATGGPVSSGAVRSSSLPKSGPGSGTDTVKVGVQCPVSGIYAAPECLSTFNAMAAYANSKGGINGYKIQIDQCDDSTAAANPGVAASCAKKQIIEDGDTVIVGMDSGLGVTAIADAHGVPLVAPIDVEADWDSAPMSFPVAAWTSGGWAALIKYLTTHGFRHPAYTDTQSTIGADSMAAINQGFAKTGISPKSVAAPLTAVSFQPQVETLQAEGVDSVYPILGDQGIVAMVQEADAIGYHPAWVTIFDSYDQRVEKILGPLGSSAKLYATTPFKSYAVAGQLEKSVVQQYAPGQSWDFSFRSISNWIGMEILFQALEKMSGTATPAKIVQQLHTDSFTSEWLPGSVNWKNTAGPYCQIASTQAYIYKMENGVWTQLEAVNAPPPQPVAGCHKS